LLIPSQPDSYISCQLGIYTFFPILPVLADDLPTEKFVTQAERVHGDSLPPYEKYVLYHSKFMLM
jgi:hypothetical protein